VSALPRSALPRSALPRSLRPPRPLAAGYLAAMACGAVLVLVGAPPAAPATETPLAATLAGLVTDALPHGIGGVRILDLCAFRPPGGGWSATIVVAWRSAGAVRVVSRLEPSVVPLPLRLPDPGPGLREGVTPAALDAELARLPAAAAGRARIVSVVNGAAPSLRASPQCPQSLSEGA
jgi:hypothetical protein